MAWAVTDHQLTLELTLGAETRLQDGLRSITTCTLILVYNLYSDTCVRSSIVLHATRPVMYAFLSGQISSNIISYRLTL